MVDTNILMSAYQPDTATPFNRFAQQDLQNQDQQNQNALASERLLQEHFQTLDAREKSRLTSTVAGAAQLKTFLDRGDLDGAHNFLLQRRGALHNRMASGENIDTEETDYALQAIRSGNVDKLKNEVDGVIAAGRVYGILDNDHTPANIKEWQQYSAMRPEDQKRYLEMKRSNQIANLGGSQMVIGPTGQPVANYTVSPKPEEMPEFKFNQSLATQQGRNVADKQAGFGKAQTALNNFKQQATMVVDNVDKAIATISPWSTGYGNFLANMPNTDARKLENYLTTIKANLGFDKLQAMREASPTGGAIGQVSDFENKLLQAINGALDPQQADQLLENLQVIKQLYPQVIAERESAFQRDYGQNGTAQTPTGGGQKVRVSNGRETFEIDASDLSAAESEGFKRQ